MGNDIKITGSVLRTYRIWVDADEELGDQEIDVPTWIVEASSLDDAIDKIADDLCDSRAEKLIVHTERSGWQTCEVQSRPKLTDGPFATSLADIMGDQYKGGYEPKWTAKP